MLHNSFYVLFSSGKCIIKTEIMSRYKIVRLVGLI